MKTGPKTCETTLRVLAMLKGESLLIPERSQLDAARATARNHGFRVSYRKQDQTGFVLTMKGRLK